jgi:hypothetical protein
VARWRTTGERLSRSSYTVHTRLRRNERLAIKRLQQTDVRHCQEPLQQGSKRALSVPSTLRKAAISRKCCGKGGNTQSAGWKAMLASLLSGTSSCTDATHTCRQGAVVQYKGQSRHTHEHQQGNQYRPARRSSYTVHTRLRRNQRLAIERSQQTDVRDCQEPLLQKGSKRTPSQEEEAVTPCARPARRRRSSYTVPSQEEEAVTPLPSQEKEEAVTPWLPCNGPRFLCVALHAQPRRRRSVTRRSSDYVATNRWLGKGCSREEQGAVTSPTSKSWKGTSVLKLTIAHPPQRSHGMP